MRVDPSWNPRDTGMAAQPSRILYVCHAAPVTARLGPARRHFHMLEQLSRFYDVDLLSLGDPSDGESLRMAFGDRVARLEVAAVSLRPFRKRLYKTLRTCCGRCDFLPVLEPNLRARCAEMTASTRYAAIVLSSVLLRGLPLRGRAAVVGDTHNAEFDVLRRTARHADNVLLRQYAALQWRATRREEQRCARNVDLLLATSERDRRVFEQELGVRHVAVIPNGIDLSEFAPASAPPDRRTIVFSGLMSYYPNRQAVRWFLDSILPLIRRRIPDARFIVAGASPPRWLRTDSTSRVEVTGSVPDIRPFVDRATVMVAPLLIAGGTRVKILEALASGKPVVSTSIGAEGLELRDGESVLIADDAESFARRVIDVLSDPTRAAALGENGRRHVARHFNWDLIGERVARVLETRLGIHARTSVLTEAPPAARVERLAR